MDIRAGLLILGNCLIFVKVQGLRVRIWGKKKTAIELGSIGLCV